MPCTEDRLIAISEQCNYAIIRSEEGIELLKYDSFQKKWSSTTLGRMDIDESFYSKAVFCSDGENIIYQKKGKEFFLRRIGSDKESVFEPQGSIIRRNINGYIPYLDFDTHRKPIYVDPVSLTRVKDEAAGQFSYMSVDGSITHVGHNIIKYYSYEKKNYVTKEEYDNYVAKYDYEQKFNLPIKTGPHFEEVKNNRTTYYNANKSWLDDKIRQSFYISRFLNNYNHLGSFLNFTSICDSFIFKKEYFVREMMRDEIIDIPIPQPLYFLNYVSYSYDNRYVLISGRFPWNSLYKGLALVFDVKDNRVVYRSTSTKAVWLGVFSKQGMVAYYDSTPCSYISNNVANAEDYEEIEGRSFLTFSPSGKYAALSRQGYIPYISGQHHWGHQPSRDIYIVRCDTPNKELAHYCDHGDLIEGSGNDRTNSSVASATFSKDDKKLMTVSKDGVIVVRNLHLEDS